MDALMKQQQFFACEYEGVSHDCGSKLGWLQANIALGANHPELGDEIKAFIRSLK